MPPLETDILHNGTLQHFPCWHLSFTILIFNLNFTQKCWEKIQNNKGVNVSTCFSDECVSGINMHRFWIPGNCSIDCRYDRAWCFDTRCCWCVSAPETLRHITVSRCNLWTRWICVCVPGRTCRTCSNHQIIKLDNEDSKQTLNWNDATASIEWMFPVSCGK